MRWCAFFLALRFALAAVAAAPAGLFVAVGQDGRRMSSEDGRTWKSDTFAGGLKAAPEETIWNVAFGLGRFVAVGGGAEKGRIVATRDGRRWRELAALRGAVGTIVFGGGRFIAGHGAELLWSEDGEKFVAGERLDLGGAARALRAAWGDGEGGHLCVIIGDLDPGDGKPRVSWRASTADGVRFASHDLASPRARDVAYGAGHWVVVGPEGLIESSHDGQTWQRQESAPGEDFRRIVWTGTRFLVSGGKTAWSSSDGFAWRKEAFAPPCNLAWAREGELGLGFSPGGNIYVSSDLLKWKKLPLPPGPSFEAVVLGTP